MTTGRTIGSSLPTTDQAEKARRVMVRAINRATRSLEEMAGAFARLQQAMNDALPRIRAEQEFLRRHEFWKRGESFPEYVADVNEKEWWQDGEDPPGFIAA